MLLVLKAKFISVIESCSAFFSLFQFVYYYGFLIQFVELQIKPGETSIALLLKSRELHLNSYVINCIWVSSQKNLRIKPASSLPSAGQDGPLVWLHSLLLYCYLVT